MQTTIRVMICLTLVGLLGTPGLATPQRTAIESARLVKEIPSSTEPVLRSAWMLTDSREALPAWPEDAGQERLLIQRHFHRVEEILVANTQQSLATAADRFERALGQPLTRYQRARLRSALFERRVGQIVRLRAYREAGRFPLNSAAGAPPRPVFVDEHGTECAVGHLMSCSGWQWQVASIAETNNFVVVSDVREGPLVAWVLQSGLTHEEAALIQPFYGPPSHYRGPLSQFMQPGAHLDQSGLRFDNFTFTSATAGANAVSPDGIQLITDLSDITSFDGSVGRYFRPTGTNFLALHGNLGSTSGTQSLLWRMGFDASVTDPTKAISAAHLSSNAFHMLTWAGNPTEDITILFAPDGTPLIPRSLRYSGYAEYSVAITPLSQSAARISLGGPNPADFYGQGGGALDGSRGVSFDPVSKVHVEMQLVLAGDAVSWDIANEFTLVSVPEPPTLALGAFGLIALIAVGRRRRLN